MSLADGSVQPLLSAAGLIDLACFNKFLRMNMSDLLYEIKAELRAAYDDGTLSQIKFEAGINEALELLEIKHALDFWLNFQRIVKAKFPDKYLTTPSHAEQRLLCLIDHPKSLTLLRENAESTVNVRTPNQSGGRP